MQREPRKSSSGHTGRQLLIDLANMEPDRIARFRKKWDEFYRRYRDDDLLTRRDELRRLWIGEATWDEFGDELVGEEHPLEEHSWKDPRLQQVLLGSTKAAKRLIGAWNEAQEHTATLICDHWLQLEKDLEPLAVEWNFRDNKVSLKPNPRCLGAMLALGCVRLFDRLTFCRNHDCPAPYFLARRRDQKYCSDVCAAPAKREAKLRWWRKQGKRRAKASRYADFSL